MSPARSQLSIAARYCFFVFVSVVVLTASNDVTSDDVTGNPVRGSREICPSCTPQDEVPILRRLPRSAVVRLHVERIRREMLHKFGLSVPPNVTAGNPLPSIHDLPRPLLSSAYDVSDEDGVFPDDDVDYGVMSDVPSQQYYDYDYDDDDEDDDDDDDADSHGEFDVVGAELGPPPRKKQLIVFGQQRTSTVHVPIVLKLRI